MERVRGKAKGSYITIQDNPNGGTYMGCALASHNKHTIFVCLYVAYACGLNVLFISKIGLLNKRILYSAFTYKLRDDAE